MTAFDYVVLTVVGLSVLLSVWRGAIRELFALAAWIVAFFVAQIYGPGVAALLPGTIENASMRLLVGLVIVFLAVLIVAGLFALLLSKLIRAVGLGLADRALGGVFGLLRGMLVVLILVLLCGLTAMPRQPMWREAMLSAPLEAAALAVKSYLPSELYKRISYD
jgi:membrane protein required for colicin V production